MTFLPNPNDLKPKILDQFNMTKNERLELNSLSKLVYNSSSKWQKMVTKGEVAPQVEKLEDGTERSYKGISYYSVPEIKKIMLELKAEQEADTEKELKEAQENEARKQADQIKKMAGEENIETQEKAQEIKSDIVKEILETVED